MLFPTTICQDESRPWSVKAVWCHIEYVIDILTVQTFTCFVFLDLVSAVQNRGLGCGLFQNKMLISTVSISFLVQLTLIYVPFMQSIFQTEALSSHDISRLLLIGAISAALHEGRRRYEQALDADMTYSSAAQEMA